MPSRTRKLLVGLTSLVFALLACNLPGGTPLPPTVTPVPPVPPTPSLPVVSAPQIVSFQMLDADNGWALTDTNLLRTVDGGSTWYDTTPPGVSTLGYAAAPFYLDDLDAWVALQGSDPTSGSLYRTTDGGATWTGVSVPFGGGTLSFVDPSHGWDLVGLSAGMSHQSVAVFTTSDGGATWTQVFVDDPTYPGSSDSLPLVGDKNGISALDATHAWVTGAEPVSDFVYIYTTQDGGHTWAHQDVPLPAAYAGGMTSASLPSFFGPQGVLPVLLVADTNGVVFYNSPDSGLTWTASQPVAQGGFICTASAADFFVWDGGPVLNASHDSGATWSTVSPNIAPGDTLASFQFVDAGTGWALTDDAGGHRSFYKTTDGGATWTALVP